jgi:hypothetical protein
MQMNGLKPPIFCGGGQLQPVVFEICEEEDIIFMNFYEMIHLFKVGVGLHITRMNV